MTVSKPETGPVLQKRGEDGRGEVGKRAKKKIKNKKGRLKGEEKSDSTETK